MTINTTARRARAPVGLRRISPQATALFTALGIVLKQLRRTPLPRSASDREAFQGNPAPRHIETWLQIAADGPMSVSDLAEKMQVTLATMSQVVTELTEMMLIERRVDETDRRRVMLSVGKHHRELLNATLERRLLPVERTLERLSAAEGVAFIRGLEILAEELSPKRRAE